jgi:hypothetical protein
VLGVAFDTSTGDRDKLAEMLEPIGSLANLPIDLRNEDH